MSVDLLTHVVAPDGTWLPVYEDSAAHRVLQVACALAFDCARAEAEVERLTERMSHSSMTAQKRRAEKAEAERDALWAEVERLRHRPGDEEVGEMLTHERRFAGIQARAEERERCARVVEVRIRPEHFGADCNACRDLRAAAAGIRALGDAP